MENSFVLALLAVAVLAPLLYIPGFLLARALLGAAQPPDLLERHYERVVGGALLNGWLAFLLAELGIFAAWLHLLLLIAICAGCLVAALRRGSLRLPQSPLGIAVWLRPTFGTPKNTKHRPKPENHRATPRSSFIPSLRSGQAVRRSSLAAYWDALAFAAVGALFALLVARPFEVVLGVRDAGVYANIGFAIARTGGIVQYDPVVARIGQDRSSDDPALRAAAAQAETNMLGVQHPERNIATRLRAAGFYINAGDLDRGRVVPQFFHLYPAWIGLLAALLGLHGGLLATGVLGFLGVWGVGLLGRRLAGPWVGLLAMLFLALNGVQVWFSRYSTSEATVQFLTFAGLYAFAVMNGRELSLVRGPSLVATDHRPRTGFAALIAGLAFGQVALARIDFALVVVPVVAYLFYIWLTKRWSRVHTLLAAGLGAMLLHAALHVIFIARAYFFDTLYARLQDYALTALAALPFLTPTLRTYYLSRATSRIGIRLGPAQYVWNWRRIAVEAAVVVLALACVFALRRWGQPLLAAGERVARRWSRALLLLSAAGIVALAGYGYLIRPQILTPTLLEQLPACISPAQLGRPSAACLQLQGYIGAPIAIPKGGREVYTIPLANLVRVGWYLSPLGIILGVAGFALWWRRGMGRESWLFLTIGLLTTIFFVRQSYGASDQSYIYILRRYVPQVYPALSLGIAYALVALARLTTDDRRLPLSAAKGQAAEGRLRRWWSVVGGWGTIYRASTVAMPVVLGLALVGFLALTNRGIYQHVEYGGALAQLETLAGRFGPRDVLLFHSGSRDEPDLLATPLTFAFGLNAFTIKSSQPERYAQQLARYIQRWQEQGRSVYLLFGPSGGFGLPGVRLVPDGRMALRHLDEFEQLQDQKPHNVQDFNLDFAVYQIAGAPDAQPNTLTSIAVDDYGAQLRGFYRAEQIGGTALAWTQGDALLRLPWQRAAGPRTVVVRLAGGVRPAALGPARACLSFRPELPFGSESPAGIFGTLDCFDLRERMAEYRLIIDPRVYPDSGAGALLLRVHSDTWVPAQADPTQADRRQLGVQFGGLDINPP